MRYDSMMTRGPAISGAIGGFAFGLLADILVC